MISTSDRREAIELIATRPSPPGRERRTPAKLLGLSVRTVQRWTRNVEITEHRRPHGERPTGRPRPMR